MAKMFSEGSEIIQERQSSVKNEYSKLLDVNQSTQKFEMFSYTMDKGL